MSHFPEEDQRSDKSTTALVANLLKFYATKHEYGSSLVDMVRHNKQCATVGDVDRDVSVRRCLCVSCFTAQLSQQMCLRHVSFEVLKKSVRTRLTNAVCVGISELDTFLLSIIISFFDLVAGWNVRAPSINEFGFFWNGGNDICWGHVQCQSTSLKQWIFHREWVWLGGYHESKAHVNPDCPVRRFRQGPNRGSFRDLWPCLASTFSWSPT